MTANKEWLKDIKISQELKDKIYYDKENDLWVISWNAISQSLTELEELQKRDTPLKVEQSWEEEDNQVFDCPHCGETWFYSNDSDEWKFCPNCGQRLDWGGKDE